MKKLYIIFAILALTNYIMAESCWSLEEKKDSAFSELDDKIELSFKDAQDCSVISNTNVNIDGQIYITDERGIIVMDVPDDDINEYLLMKVKKSGYISYSQKVLFSSGSVWQTRFLLSKNIELDSARFVLGWDSAPKDLDLHLVSEDFHISYRNKDGKSFKAKLDRDSMQGYGPETITLNKIDNRKTYKVYVYKYSNDAQLDQSVNVSFYLENRLDRVISLSENLDGKCIYIGQIKNNRAIYNPHKVDSSYCK